MKTHDEIVRGWEEFLGDHMETYHDLNIEEYGFTFQEYVFLVMLNRIHNQLLDVEDTLIAPDEGDEWKG